RPPRASRWGVRTFAPSCNRSALMSHGNPRGPRARLSLTALEDRSTPAAAAAAGPYAVGVLDGRTGDVVVHAADGSVQYTVPNPYGSDFPGGVRIALGDVNGDGTSDLVVGAGFGGGPRIAVYDGASLAQGKQVKLVNDFFAFEDTLRNGVFPTVGDLNGDGCGDLIFGAGPGGSPRVLALDGKAALAGGEQTLANFFAGPAGSRPGAEVGTRTVAP